MISSREYFLSAIIANRRLPAASRLLLNSSAFTTRAFTHQQEKSPAGKVGGSVNEKLYDGYKRNGRGGRI
ncbi:MAG: hypothetical protein ACREPG_12585 [Candidatus Binatia bacterium]